MADPGREWHHGVNIRAVIAVAVGLALTIGAIAAIVGGLTRAWDTPLAGPNTRTAAKVNGPALEPGPQQERARFFADKDALLQRYEWIDRERGIARIPIDVAMQVLAGKPASITPDARRASYPKPIVSPVQEPAAISERLGAQLPLEVEVVNERAEAAPLSGYFGRVPVALVFGYYRCPALCTTMMEGVLVAASAADLPASGYRIVGVSIDPRETSADAARKAAAYRAAHGGLPLDLLTVSRATIEKLTTTAGVRYQPEPRSDDFVHPLAMIVATPDGRIARYVPGVAIAPREMRLALVEASQGRIGSLAERVYLRCAHYDPVSGRYSIAVMTWVRLLSGALVIVLALWIWRHRKSR